MELTDEELARAHFGQLGAGIVLVGGGAKLSGLVALAERTLKMPVRIGQPSGIEDMGEVLPDPAFAVLVGLALYANRRRLLEDSQETGWTDRLKKIFTGEDDE